MLIINLISIIEELKNIMRRKKHKRQKIIASIIIIAELTIIAVCLSIWWQEATRPQVVYFDVPVKVQAKPVNERESILNYIREVFRGESDRAIQLLTDKRCHENYNLNPLAVHDNEKWGQGLGQDIGVFQISEYWQQIPRKFLFNYKINVLVAYQLYTENGHSFKLWTCGKVLGI